MVNSVFQTVIFRATTILLVIVVVYFFISMGIFLLKELVQRIRKRLKWKHLNALYDVLFEEIPLNSLSLGIFQRQSLIEAFTEILSMITGNKKERMKHAVTELGLLKYIQKWLFSILPTKRMRACHTLGLLGSLRQSELLTLKLNDFNPKVVSSAIIALGEIRALKTVPALFTYYRHCPAQHAWLISAICPFFGHDVYEHMRPLLTDKNLPDNKRLLLIKALAVLKPPESLSELIHLYNESGNLDIRISALMTVGNINDLWAVKTVIDALGDRQWEIRAIAAGIIGDMAIKGASYRLVPLLKDPNWYVRKNTARSLVRLGLIGISALIDSIDSDDRFARDMSVQTLEENGIIEEMLAELTRKESKEAGLALKMIRLLITHGYFNYLKNFRDSCSILQSMLSERPDNRRDRHMKRTSLENHT